MARSCGRTIGVEQMFTKPCGPTLVPARPSSSTTCVTCFVRYEVLKAVTSTMLLFWGLPPCKLVGSTNLSEQIRFLSSGLNMETVRFSVTLLSTYEHVSCMFSYTNEPPQNVQPLRYRHAGDKGRRDSSYSLLTSAPDGASRPDRALPPGKGPPVPTVYEAGCASELVWLDTRD